MDEPLHAHTFNEARCYLMVTACAACGGGPWEIVATEQPDDVRDTTLVTACCRNCRARRTLAFLCEHEPPEQGPQAECLNPTDAPSRIIDLGQWLSLFYAQVEAASGTRPAAKATRREGYRAALCLAESLKFYGDGPEELPPASAFFTQASADAFREHPEKFARQALRDMQARLPSLATVARKIQRDRRAGRDGWWRRRKH